MVVITIIFWSILLLDLIHISGYEIIDGYLIVRKRASWIKYNIDIKNIVKVYKTRFPDELLISGGKISLSEYVQIEFKDLKGNWTSTYVGGDCDLFIKQIELMQKDYKIKSFLFPSEKIIKVTQLASFVFCLLIALLCDSYFASYLYKHIIGGPFGIPVLEVIIYIYMIKKLKKIHYKHYYDNLEKFAIR